jgi:hypothetical protein
MHVPQLLHAYVFCPKAEVVEESRPSLAKSEGAGHPPQKAQNGSTAEKLSSPLKPPFSFKLLIQMEI